MAPLLLSSLILALLGALPAAQASCPVPSSLKPVNGTRICAQLYDKSDAYYENCCAGAQLNIEPGADMPYLPSTWSRAASSLVVGSRCELTVWSRPGKQGKTRKFSSGAYPRLAEYRLGVFGDWNNAIAGLYCKCNN